MKLRVLAAALVFLLIGCSGDEERLKIKRDIANLQEQIYALEKTQSDLKSEVERAVDALKTKVDDRSAQAGLQDQVYSIKETLSQYEALLQDLESKIDRVGKTQTQVSTAPTESIDNLDGSVPMENVSGEVVEQQFNQALLDFNRGKYQVAALGFKGVLENFPNSPFTEGANYYLGRSYTELKQYQNAGEVFRNITTRFANGDYIKQAMYYEGQCYYYLNQHSKAIITLRDLIDRFPGTQESVLAKQFLKKAGYEK